MSSLTLLQQIEKEQERTDLPYFSPGDTLAIKLWVLDGNKKRLQAFEGIVIAKKNRGLNSAFTLRKRSHGIDVERVFQLHSPIIESIAILKRGLVRKAKLYYLRDKAGKAARIAERIIKKPSSQ